MTAFSVLILPLSFALTLIALKYKFNTERTFFYSIILWCLYLFILTETTGLFCVLSSYSLLAGWALYCLIFGYFIYKHKSLNILFVHNLKLDRNLESFLILFSIALMIIMFIISLLSPPNNWDSLTYHLSRVMNWMQNKSVNYYASNIKRSLYSPVFAEYIVLNIYELSGNDYFVNLVQWFSYVYSSIGVYFILRKIEVSKKYCILGLFLTCSLPMAIAQSCSTQVDLVGSMWLVVFSWFVLEISSIDKLNCKNLNQVVLFAMCATSIGLGYITKSTVCFAMLVMLIYILVIRLKAKDKIIQYIIFGTVSLLVIMLITLPTFIRNFFETGDILASDYMSGIMVGTINPVLLFLNLYKNCGMLGIRPKFVHLIGTVGEKLAYKLGKDINAPEISHTFDFANNLNTSFDKDYAPNSIVMYTFILASLIIIVWIIKNLFKKKKRYSIPKYLGYIVSCIFSVILLCVSVRYQMWGNRLLLPALYIMCIVIAYTIDKSKLNNGVKYYWCILIVLFALMDVYNCVDEQINPVRDYFRYGDRKSVYFRVRANKEPYDEIKKIVNPKGYKNIGIKISEDTFEYPLWMDLKTKENRIFHIVNLNANDDKRDEPDCIIMIDQDKDYTEGNTINYIGNEYKCIWAYDDDGQYAVLEKGIRK